MQLSMLLSPVLGGVIGYITNYIAIKMLFYPHTEKYIFKMKIPFTPGLIPKERGRLAEKVGITVSNQLVTGEVLDEALQEVLDGVLERFIVELIDSLKNSDDDIQSLINRAPSDVSNMINSFADNVIETNNTKLEDFLDDELDKKLEGMLKKAIEDNFGRFIGSFINHEKVYTGIKKSVISPELFTLLKSKLLKIKIKNIINAIGESRLQEITELLINAAKNTKDKGVRFVSQSIDVKEIVTRRINELDIVQIEDMILSVARRELRAITIAGGVLGAVIGLIPLIFGT